MGSSRNGFRRSLQTWPQRLNPSLRLCLHRNHRPHQREGLLRLHQFLLRKSRSKSQRLSRLKNKHDLNQFRQKWLRGIYGETLSATEHRKQAASLLLLLRIGPEAQASANQTEVRKSSRRTPLPVPGFLLSKLLKDLGRLQHHLLPVWLQQRRLLLRTCRIIHRRASWLAHQVLRN